MNAVVARPIFAAAVIAVAFAFCGPASAIEWPLPGARMTRNFGFNDGGRPVAGVELSGGGNVLAASDGEVIFDFSPSGGYSSFPSPLGEWTAVDHGGGLVGIYARHGGRVGNPNRLSVGEGTPLAAAGISGRSNGEGVFFIVYDRMERRWVNPAMIAPPLADAIPPQIRGVRLVADGGIPEGVDLRQGTVRGRHVIAVDAVDALSGGMGSALAPQRIVVSVNGTEVGNLVFEMISARDGEMFVGHGSSAAVRRVYSHFPAFEAGEVMLNSGQAIIEIIVRDIAGNSASVTQRVSVE